MIEQGNPDPGLSGALCANHPQRAAVGTCDRCGNFYCGRCAGRSENGAGYCMRCWSGRSYVPWEDASLGRFVAFFETVKRSLLELPVFSRELPARGGLAQPLLFALLPTMLSSLLAASAIGLFLGAMVPALVPEDAPLDSGYFALGAFLGYFALFVVSYLLYLFLWPLALMLVAHVFGGRRPPTYEGMFRILCYSSGFNLLYFFPGISILVWAYHAVVAVACVSRQLETGIGRAVAIYMIPLAGVTVGCLGGYALLFMLVGALSS